MTVTARKHALFNRISPKLRHLAGLYFLEIVVILSWTLLMDTIFNLISGYWFMLMPVSYFFSVIMLAWLERTRSGNRGHSPLEALGLAEIGMDGFKPSEWQTLRRLFLTPPLILMLGLGLITVPGTGKTILQIISSTKIVPLDTNMDPRSEIEILGCKRKALMKVISYTMVSLLVTAVIILVPPELTETGTGNRISSIHDLPKEERELLASYLEMMSMYPDSLEFHVRLASLYYRNNMEVDLLLQLEHIRRIDPDHSILMLEEDMSITMEDLMVGQDSTYNDSIPITQEPVISAEDTSAQDSLVTLPDSVSIDLRLVASDSTGAAEDSISTAESIAAAESIATAESSMPDDSIEIDYSVEQDSLSLPVEEDSVPDSVIPVYTPDETAVEDTVESIVTEDTTAVEAAGGMESTEDTRSGESSGATEENSPSISEPEGP